MEYRIEHDTMGDVRVPADALYAAQTQRAVENFPISGRGLSPHHIAALAQIKRAAAIVKAVTHYNDPHILAEVSRNLGEPMVGRSIASMPEEELIAGRGW